MADPNLENIKLSKDGTLKYMTTVSQILLGVDENQSYPEHITDNLIENVDRLEALQRKDNPKFKNKRRFGHCPNLYPGKNERIFSEKFIEKRSIEISLNSTEENSLTLTHNDLKKLQQNKQADKGAFGSIFFLKNIEFENDLDNEDYKKMKSQLVIKKQERKISAGANVKKDPEERCFAFNELTEIQFKKLWKETSNKHTNLYVTHSGRPL